MASIVVLLAVALVAWSIWKGRYWARWAVLGLWVLAPSPAPSPGYSLFAITASIPNAFKVAAAGQRVLHARRGRLLMLPSSGRTSRSTSRPRGPGPRPGVAGCSRPRTAGATARDPRPPRAPGPVRAAATTPAADDAAAADRSRTKQRANAASVAKGAELARTRAKAASKSRRTES